MLFEIHWLCFSPPLIWTFAFFNLYWFSQFWWHSVVALPRRALSRCFVSRAHRGPSAPAIFTPSCYGLLAFPHERRRRDLSRRQELFIQWPTILASNTYFLFWGSPSLALSDAWCFPLSLSVQVLISYRSCNWWWLSSRYLYFGVPQDSLSPLFQGKCLVFLTSLTSFSVLMWWSVFYPYCHFLHFPTLKILHKITFACYNISNIPFGKYWKFGHMQKLTGTAVAFLL